MNKKEKNSMKKIIMNYEIENILTILNDKSSFRNDMSVKLPKSARQALRINLNTLNDRMKVFEEGRKEIYTKFIEDNKADKTDDGNYKIRDEYMPELNQELIELAVVQNNLEIEPIDMAAFDNVDLSIKEEEVLEYMTEAKESAESVEPVDGEVVDKE